MLRFDEPTPCPAPWVGANAVPNSRRPSKTDFTLVKSDGGAETRQDTWMGHGLQLGDDATENVDFTTEFRASIRSAAPRRRMTMSRKPHVFNAANDIYQDARPRPTTLTTATQARPARVSLLPSEVPGSHNRRSSILAQPAQRVPAVAEATRPVRRRVSAVLAEMEANRSRGAPQEQNNVAQESKITKAPRRRTIYVPSDDTTIMTIHPGASIKEDDVPKEAALPYATDLDTLPEDVAAESVPLKRPPRKSLAAAPKRAPLQSSGRVLQDQQSGFDIVGQGHGKENIPPGFDLPQFSKKFTAAPRRQSLFKFDDASNAGSVVKDVDRAPTDTKPFSRPEGGRPTFKRTTSKETEEEAPTKICRGERPLPSFVGAQPLTINKAANMESNRDSSQTRASQHWISGPASLRPESLPTKLSVPHVDSRVKSADCYPVLEEDLCRPELYEDNWLRNQEEAITQLINRLFDAADADACRSTYSNHQELRAILLRLYHDASFSLLFKRLQASLLYGALSVSKDLIANTLRLRDDVGLRHKFLSFWLDTYHLPVLKAAAEVIVGREIPSASRMSDHVTAGGEEQRRKPERRTLEGFLESFLVRNEDAVRMKNCVGSIGRIARSTVRTAVGDVHHEDYGTEAWSWRRTVLRSLMLMLLLDKSKSQCGVRGCLFLPSSSFKSSSSALSGFAKFLMPSLGDVARPLGHLNYTVSHVQTPLQEFDFKIGNLAVDLRDGVRLTHIVELLLYPRSLTSGQDDVTITMPTGDILTSPCKVSDAWVLSRHLKFPPSGHALKIHNVHIALAALDGVTNGLSPFCGVKAEDIVNGHREKTVGLLWGLVSQWGLNALLDWEALKKEIKRLKRRAQESAPSNMEEMLAVEKASEEESAYEESEEQEKQTLLLQRWASNIARLHGLRVTNMSTSFADGRVFQSIVDEYECYLPRSSPTSTETDLEGKLRRLGCSNYFAGLFKGGVRQGRIFDKTFVTAALAFMCSRLLQASVKGRAATTIQRAYRHCQLRRQMHKRMVLMRLAHDCQTVVTTRDTVIGAAKVLQNAWRRCLDRKVDKLVKCLTMVQARGRGAIVRQKLACQALP
ncbi:MAG: hypothetical protein M1833_004470 [Piccolia ochrophora]|nr:MAG: hypothetical protein M1833_004470 [Piccolia ochrophora]